MKRFGRYLFNTLAVLSLLLCLMAGGLWWRSYRVGDLFHARTEGQWFYVTLAEGHVVIGGWSRGEWNPPSLHPDHVRYTIAEARNVLKVHGGIMAVQGRFLGIERRRGRSRPMSSGDVVFSFGHVVALTGALPALAILMMAWRGLRGGAAKASGTCLTYGYDLRATPERCPECGRVA